MRDTGLSALFVSDLHLTDKPRDDYRWALFSWIIQLLNTIPDSVPYLFILGDLTDAKDYHSASLVNCIVEALVDVKQKTGLQEIIILRGNHDGVDPAVPYFGFLNRIPGIRFVSEPDAMLCHGDTILMLPHSRNPERDWVKIPMREADYILLHATVKGALGENACEIPGASTFQFPMEVRKHCVILSGDVHVPQKVGRVEYVGAPYHIKFGDTFEPRAVLFLSGERQPDIPIPGMRKHLVVMTNPAGEIFDLEKLPRGDQVKIRLRLSKEDYVNWEQYKKIAIGACKEYGLDLCGLELQKRERPTLKKQQVPAGASPEEVVRKFGARNKLDDATLETGIELLPKGD